MEKSFKSRSFNDVFTVEEINELRHDHLIRPITIVEKHSYSKNLDYDIPESAVHRIVKKKLDKIIGPDHQVCAGAYKEVHVPYAAHTDNNYWLYQKEHLKPETHHYDISVLIPLCEDPELRTVVFDVDSEENPIMGEPLPENFLSSSNDLDLKWFTHIDEPARSQISKLPVDQILQWKIGSMFTWPRTTLHASTDFSKFGLIKKFIIIFIR